MFVFFILTQRERKIKNLTTQLECDNAFHFRHKTMISVGNKDITKYNWSGKQKEKVQQDR